MIDPFRNVPARWFAVAAFAFFAPVVASFAISPGNYWINYPGLFFHLAVFMLGAKLPAPEWARAAGYGWLLLDVMTGVLALNHVPPSISMYVRLSGHIFAGIWVMTSSLSGSRSMKYVGIVTGAWISSYTFFSPFVSMKILGPDSVLFLVWLVTIALQPVPRVREASQSGII